MEAARKTNKYEMDMCHGPLLRQLISFSLPLVLSSNLQLLFNAVDIIVVGQFSGDSALASVGATTSFINLTITLLIGISMGTSVMAGRYFAIGDKKGMTETVHTSMTFALFGGIIIGALAILFSDRVLTLMDTPAEVFDGAVLYTRIYFLGMPFFMLYNYGAAVLRAVGDTKRPLLFLIIAGISNACLNLVLVIVFHLGVMGVAIATVLSQIISCVLVLRCLFLAEGSYRLQLSKCSIRLPYLLQMLKIGLPAGLQSFVINFSNMLLQSSVNSFGKIAVAGYTAANNIFGFLFVTINAFSQTCMSFLSQNYGAKKLKRMDQVLWECMALSVGVMLVLGTGVYLLGEPILRIYTSNPAVIDCGMEIFLYTTCTYFLCSIMDLFPSAMRGVGVSTIPMLLSVVGTVGVRIIWIFFVFPFYHSLDVLFISYPLSWGITVLMQLVCFYFVRKRVKQELSC